jgi:hypothetical protein
MLKNLALMFVLHVVALGVIFGRRTDFTRMSRLGWAFMYLLLFYIGWGLLFALMPDIIVPDLLPF